MTCPHRWRSTSASPRRPWRSWATICCSGPSSPRSTQRPRSIPATARVSRTASCPQRAASASPCPCGRSRLGRMRALMRYDILSVLAAALILSPTACSDLTSINHNPNGPTDVDPPSILSSAIDSVVSGVDGPNNNLDVRGGGLWVQYYAEVQYRDEDKYIVRPGVDGGWGFYNGALEDAQRMIDKGVAAGVPNWEAVGRIMKSYTFGVMTDAMGDIPYSEALKGSAVLAPKYDSQRDIYTALFADLAKADQQID